MKPGSPQPPSDQPSSSDESPSSDESASAGAPPGREVEAEPRWGLGDALGGFLVGLVVSGLVASAWLGATGDEELSQGGQALTQLGLWTGLLGSVVLASRRKGAGRLAVDFGFDGRAPDFPIGAIAGVLSQAALLPAIAFLLRPVVGQPDVSGPVNDLFESTAGLGIVGLVLFVVVGAPLVEELFFRGLLLRSLQRRIGTFGAVAVSSVLFGLAHPQPLPQDGQILVMVSLTALAAVLATLAVRTRRLAPSIVAHMAFNAWTTVFLLT